jgi:hypothetical protein
MATKIRSKWRKSVRYESAPTSATLSSDTSFTVSEAVSAPASEPVSVEPTPTSSGDSVTLFRPGQQQDLLVDEVANDTDLATHPDVRWYCNHDNLADHIGNGTVGVADMYIQFSNWPADYGHTGTSKQAEAALGGLYSLRSPSCYAPDHYISNVFSGGRKTYGTSGESAPWIGPRKWFRHGIASSPSSGQHTPLGTEQISDVWLRMVFMLETSVLSGMTGSGAKLGGVSASHLGGNSSTMHFSTRLPGENRWRLQCYWSGGDLTKWRGGSPTDYSPTNTGGSWLQSHGTGTKSGLWYGGVPDYYIQPDTWNCLEWHFKLNSAAGVRDGERKVWFNNQLVVYHPECELHNYSGANPIEFGFLYDQVFHGGTVDIPTQVIYARTAGWCLAKRRIGPPTAMGL